MYAAETMSVTKKEENALQTIGKKIWGTILKPVKTSKTHRRRTNHEILVTLKQVNMVESIKVARIRQDISGR